MKRLILSSLVALIAVCPAQSQTTTPRPPIQLEHYRVLPRLSTLHVSGGFAGFDDLYRLTGEYDFAHSIGPDSSARFVDPEIWGSPISKYPTIAIVRDVDAELNLTGLKGEAIPVGAPFDVYGFRGETAEGSPLRLFAAVVGPWMYVKGASRARPDTADMFEYELRMVAHQRPFLDPNGDGRVDAADYVALRDQGGSSEALGGAGAVVGDSILLDWQAQFGQEAPDFGSVDAMLGSMLANEGAPVASSTPIPEPATLLLSFLAAGLFCGFSILRRSRGGP